METPEPAKITLLCKKIKELKGKVQITIDSSTYDFKYNLVHDIDYEYNLVVVDELMAKAYGIAYDQSKFRMTRRGVEIIYPYIVALPIRSISFNICVCINKDRRRKRGKISKWRVG